MTHLDLRLLGVDVDADQAARDLANDVFRSLDDQGHDVDGVAPILRGVDRPDTGLKRCDVNGCEGPALALVTPTHGVTDDSAWRCRPCVERDLERGWFREWRRALREARPEVEQLDDPDVAADGGAEE